MGSSSKPHIADDDEEEDKEDDKPSEIGGIIKLLLKILAIGLLALAIGGGLVFAISKVAKRGPSIEDKLAKAEEKLSGKGGAGKDKADVMEIKDEEPKKVEEAEVVEDKKKPEPKPEPKPESKPEPKPETASTPPPKKDRGPAPSWLQPSAGAQAPDAGQPSASAPTPVEDTELSRSFFFMIVRAP